MHTTKQAVRPYLQPRALGLGLAGGLLAELVLLNKIRIWPGGVTVTDRTPPQDALACSALGLVLSEREQHAARTWLLFLAQTAAGDVASRLEHAGYLTQPAGRRRWRAERLVPVDADCAFAPVVRLQSALGSSRPVTAQAAALAGLAAACGLGSRLLLYAPPKARRSLSEAVEQLTPDLRDLIAQTQALVDSALLSHRA